MTSIIVCVRQLTPTRRSTYRIRPRGKCHLCACKSRQNMLLEDDGTFLLGQCICRTSAVHHGDARTPLLTIRATTFRHMKSSSLRGLLPDTDAVGTLEKDVRHETATPSEPNTNQRVVNWYGVLMTGSLISFGAWKAVASYQGWANTSNALDWAIGIVWSLM